ncbi:unnamed protein product, partial [Rotaria magnacalcarata]
YNSKASRPPSFTVDFYFSDITVNTTPIVDDLEQDSNKGIEVLESAEYEWKSETKNGQQQTDDLFSSPINSILPLFSYSDKIRYC